MELVFNDITCVGCGWTSKNVFPFSLLWRAASLLQCLWLPKVLPSWNTTNRAEDLSAEAGGKGGVEEPGVFRLSASGRWVARGLVSLSFTSRTCQSSSPSSPKQLLQLRHTKRSFVDNWRIICMREENYFSNFCAKIRNANTEATILGRLLNNYYIHYDRWNSGKGIHKLTINRVRNI